MNYIKLLLYLWGIFSCLITGNEDYRLPQNGFRKRVAMDRAPAKDFTTGVDVKLVDEHYRIYPDRFPDSALLYQPISVPRNYRLYFQLAVKSNADQDCRVIVTRLTDEKGMNANFRIRVNQLMPVHVEGNTQGSLINHPGGEPPASWKPFFIRMAPFDVLEVVSDENPGNLKLAGGKTAGALVQIDIPTDCSPGLYKGIIEVAPQGKQIPFSFRVHKAILPSSYFLHSVHWLSALPQNLKSGPACPWWSNEHWTLLKRAGRLLFENGDDVMYTPLINSHNPLIQATIDKKGDIHFDYQNFDKWITTFRSIGFKYFAGQHLSAMEHDVFVKEKETGRLVSLSAAGTKLDWFAFLSLFLNDLYQHLLKTGLKNAYIQHIYDEPGDIDKYRYYREIVKESMPGVQIIDAINSRPALFSPLVDIQVFNLNGINQQEDKIVKERAEEGRGVWLYNCSSPYPPYPNCHLDLPLTECRLWPWLCFKFGASGYLWWAANLYRGIKDEYRSSLGPAPNGTPIHPPGDDWFYYRSTKGLLNSMRIISFREGMADVTLLSMLGRSDSSQQRQIINKLIHPAITQGHNLPFKEYRRIAESISKGYETDPVLYHQAREKILDLLDKDSCWCNHSNIK